MLLMCQGTHINFICELYLILCQKKIVNLILYIYIYIYIYESPPCLCGKVVPHLNLILKNKKIQKVVEDHIAT